MFDVQNEFPNFCSCVLALTLPFCSRELYRIRVCALAATRPRPPLLCGIGPGSNRDLFRSGRCTPKPHQSLFPLIDCYPSFPSASNHWLPAKRGWQRFVHSAYGWDVICLLSPAGRAIWQLWGTGAEMTLFCSVIVPSRKGPRGHRAKGFSFARARTLTQTHGQSCPGLIHFQATVSAAADLLVSVSAPAFLSHD